MSQQLELLIENQLQWTTVSYVAPELQMKEIKPFVLLSLKELEGKPDSRTSSLMNIDKFAAVRAVVRHVSRLRSATKVAWSEDDMRLFLDGLKFPPECVNELVGLFCRDDLYENIPKHLRIKPGISGVQWKIDVSLSQNNIRNEMASAESVKEIMYRDTQVILQLQLTDGASYVYRLSLSKFHEMRYTIANALKSIIVLEKRKCMRE
ncbi:uncharacterized protein LOC126977951 [Leptidea sinapis]|uniref:uncharacterized protein LOC126977951 n=1 Tax=Leptidea sinapis TaxID=189913 RepID=UPI0021368667|nr:uncharacterized protein LOC126977951 [Leptidea sinapis]